MTQNCARLIRESLMSYGIVGIIMIFCEVAGYPFFDFPVVLVVAISILSGVPAVLINRTLPR